MSEQIAPEVEAFRKRAFRDIDRVVKTLEGLDRETVNTKPLASANSLFALASHTLGSAEWFALGRIAERSPRYEGRVEDLSGEGDHAAIVSRANAVKDAISGALAGLAPGDLDAPRPGPSGPQTVRELLVGLVAHTSEHAGHAELTRDLLLARAST